MNPRFGKVLRERVLEAPGLSGFVHQRQGINDLLFGEVHVFERVVEKVCEILGVGQGSIPFSVSKKRPQGYSGGRVALSVPRAD
ncbi:hypothetical protein [Neorhizobium sp. DAR64860/K0K1]|uniref:hypothetical protein n=1 Tax=Neorhizobium sp. DAR64860/K0K1 TaxID=3421955 RepID=UPI003D28DCF1